MHNYIKKLLEITSFTYRCIFVQVEVLYKTFCVNDLFMYVINTMSAPYYNPTIFDSVDAYYQINQSYSYTIHAK